MELCPKSPPLQITEVGPLPEPEPLPAFNRAAVLTRVVAAFTQLDDLELEVARRRMLGVPYSSISEELGMMDSEVEQVWKQARRKLGFAIFGGKEANSNPPATPASPQTGGETPAV